MNRMTMEEWKDLLKNKETGVLIDRLISVLDDIEFLESIYMTDGERHFYSEEFSDAAYRERESFCQLSSALFSILRERGVNCDHWQKAKT